MLHVGSLEKMKSKNRVHCFLAAQTISLFGSALVQYALIWQITRMTSSGTALMISTICGFVPQFLISLAAGVFADRYSRKKLLIMSDAFIALATIYLIFESSDHLLLTIYIVLVIRSFGTGLQTPVSQATLADFASDEALVKANGVMSTLQSATALLAPALSGYLLSQTSIQMVLWIDVVTALIGISLTMCLVFPTPITKQKGIRLIADLKIGFGYVKQTFWLRKLLIYQCFLMFLISPTAFMTPLCVQRIFGGELWRLSLAEMTYSFGMIAGGIWMARHPKLGQTLKTTFLAGAFYGICMMGMGSLRIMILFYLANTLIGISSPCYNVPLYSCLQQKNDADKIGRVFGILNMCNSFAMPLGMLIFGPLADRIAIGWIFTGCGVLVMMMSLWMFSQKEVISNE